MHLMRFVYRRFLAAMLSLACVLAVQSPVSPAQHNVAELVRSREQLLSFEVYHTATDALYRTAVSIESLLASKTADYVRIDSGNSEAVADLYRALANTATDPKSACRSDHIDVRWVIVMNYRDQTKDAIGIGQPYSCVQILSREAPVVASDGLLKYVQRNFPFMY